MEKHVKLLEGMENLHEWIWGCISERKRMSKVISVHTVEAYVECRCATALNL